MLTLPHTFGTLTSPIPLRYLDDNFNALANFSAPSIESLREFTATTGVGVTLVLGYYVPGDGGGGVYYYNPADTTSPDNGGTIIVDNAGRRWYLDIVDDELNVLQFGADRSGITSSTNAFNNAFKALSGLNTKKLKVPAGTFLLDVQNGSEFILYIGQVTGNNLNGLEIYGEGRTSILKFANNVGPAALMFGAGNGDVLNGMYFHDLAMNGNAANNLNSAFTGQPLRYNMGFYFFCQCSDMRFERLYMHDFSGSQWISIGDNISSHWGSNIRILDCDFINFGLSITNNFLPDCSVIYLTADDVYIEGNRFRCQPFTFNLQYGHTACEVHGNTSTHVINNKYTYVQTPIICSSQSVIGTPVDTSNFIAANNTMYQCNTMIIFDDALNDGNQTRVDIHDNVMYSTVAAGSSIIQIGYNPDTVSITRENILIHHNTVDLAGNTNTFVNFIYAAADWIRSIRIEHNNLVFLPGAILTWIGTVQNTGYADIAIRGNRLDSLGQYPGTGNPFTQPVMCYVNISPGAGSGTINSFVFEGNLLLNTAGLNYGTFGLVYLKGNINYTRVQNNQNQVNPVYPLVTDLITSPVQKTIESSYYQPVERRMAGSFPSGGGGQSAPCAAFSGANGWGAADNVSMTCNVFITAGGTAHNVTYQVEYNASAGITTQLTNTSFTGFNLFFTGSQLYFIHTLGSTATINLNFKGLSTQPISWNL